MDQINSFGRRSTEFNDVLTTARWVIDTPDYLRNSQIGLNEQNFISDNSSQPANQVYDSVFNNLNQAITRYLNKKITERGMDETGEIKGKNSYEQKRIDFVKKLKAVVKEYESRKRGPIKKAEIEEKKSLVKRRDQNIKNNAPGI